MALRIAKDTRSPSLTDTLTVDGVAFDLTGSTVKFKMRAVGSATLKVDTAAVVVTPDTAGTVRYDWAAADVDTAGDYLGWWQVTLPGGKTQDHPEFAIEIQAHAMATGLLAEVADVKAEMEDDTARASDVLIQRLLEAASQAIRRFPPCAGREFTVLGTNPQTRDIDVDPWACSARTVGIPIGDLASAPTAVVVQDAYGATVSTLTVATDIVLLPLVREPWEPITRLRLRPTVAALSDSYRLVVTGTWGFPAIPEDVRHACVLTVRAWMRSDAQGIADFDGGFGRPVSVPPPGGWMLPMAAKQILQAGYGRIVLA